MKYSGFILAAIGLFSAAGGLFDWDWFMNHRKAAFFVKIFTRTGARVFYCALGAVLAALGFLIAFGVIEG